MKILLKYKLKKIMLLDCLKQFKSKLIIPEVKYINPKNVQQLKSIAKIGLFYEILPSTQFKALLKSIFLKPRNSPGTM